MARTVNRFNTQPPEGGWGDRQSRPDFGLVSTHSRPKAAGSATPQRGGVHRVSTHSRPKAAAILSRRGRSESRVSTHSRPKAADPHARHQPMTYKVSTHSRPKAAERYPNTQGETSRVSTHSRPKAAVAAAAVAERFLMLFQHTAARRRLFRLDFVVSADFCFNTQPPEGGCVANPFRCIL